MLLLNTVKLVLIALNILPNRVRHKKIMFFIYMGTLVTHGEYLIYFICTLHELMTHLSLIYHNCFFLFWISLLFFICFVHLCDALWCLMLWAYYSFAWLQKDFISTIFFISSEDAIIRKSFYYFVIVLNGW